MEVGQGRGPGDRHVVLATPRKGVLDRDFPDSDGADHHFVVGILDQAARLCRETGMIGDCPQRDMRIEQQPHAVVPANIAAISASSASTVLGTVNLPLATPSLFPTAARATGTRRAAG